MTNEIITKPPQEAAEAEASQPPLELEPVQRRALACPNCNAPVDGAFCANCGQKDFKLQRPLWSLLEDTLGDLFAFDSRFFKTLAPLFFKPGSVTKKYMQGKRARYVPPFRQYLVVSIVFFLTLALSDLVIFDAEKVWSDIQESAQAPPEALPGGAAGESVEAVAPGQGTAVSPAGMESGDTAESGTEGKPDEMVTPIQDSSVPQTETYTETSATAETGQTTDTPAPVISGSEGIVHNLDQTVEALLRIRADKGQRRTDLENTLLEIVIKSVSGAKRVATDPVLLNRLFADWIPKLMFVMLPFFALLLKLVYVFRKRFYIEHLVFSLHFHAFVFILLTVLVLLHQYAAFSHAYLPWLLLYIPIYLVIGMWREYDQALGWAIFKGIFIAFIYFQVMALCLSLSILYGLSQL